MAVTPETPDNSLSTREKNGIAFEVLSDAGNNVADSFGLRFTLSRELRAVYKGFGLDLVKNNDDASFTLAIPATYVIRKDGTVAYHFADTDYTKRLEPEKVVEALRNL